MAVENRCEFVFLLESINGVANGDPAMSNAPRIDPITNQGIMSDVSLKNKIKNFIEIVKEGEPGYEIFVSPGDSLNNRCRDAYKACELPLDSNEKGAKMDWVRIARDYMMKKYYDVRVFGAVMSAGKNSCGRVCGPVQITNGVTVSPITYEHLQITRKARTREDKRQESGDNEFGSKYRVPYALYRFHGFVSPATKDAKDMTEEDLELLWDAILHCCEFDHSASRGELHVRKLILFKHNSKLGAPGAFSHDLFDKIKVIQKDESKQPRKYSDYEVVIDRDMPEGVELIEKL